jgi:hypothetical protein
MYIVCFFFSSALDSEPVADSCEHGKDYGFHKSQGIWAPVSF